MLLSILFRLTSEHLVLIDLNLTGMYLRNSCLLPQHLICWKRGSTIYYKVVDIVVCVDIGHVLGVSIYRVNNFNLRFLVVDYVLNF